MTLVLALAVALAAGVVAVWPLLPAAEGDRSPRVVEIPRGATAGTISRILSAQGLVRHELAFRLLARLYRVDRGLKAGRYELSPSMSSLEILSRLRRGERIKVAVTIPEGWTAEQVAGLFARKGFGSREEFLALFSRRGEVAEWVPEDPAIRYPVEGYLFPDTYVFGGEETPAEVLSFLVQRFRRAFSRDMERRARELGLTVHQVVTLASVVEKEARLEEERALIAGVFWNRLRSGMRLDADPTVRYALGKAEGPLLPADLKVDSPYNTYRRQGLPPGPIASPGLASIMAVLYPRETDYLYFVARPEGGHLFSRTLEEHRRAIASLKGAR